MGDIKRKDRPQGSNRPQPPGSDTLPRASDWEVKQRGADFEVKPVPGQERASESLTPRG